MSRITEIYGSLFTLHWDTKVVSLKKKFSMKGSLPRTPFWHMHPQTFYYLLDLSLWSNFYLFFLFIFYPLAQKSLVIFSYLFLMREDVTKIQMSFFSSVTINTLRKENSIKLVVLQNLHQYSMEESKSNSFFQSLGSVFLIVFSL